MEIDEVERALVVVAHPDDAEWMCGGTVARLVAAGAEVHYVVCTDGSHGGIDMSVSDADLAATRAAEQQAAADVLGVTSVTMLDFPNDALAPSIDLRRCLVRQIRASRPELVITMAPMRRFDLPWEWSHADHIAAGEAALIASYPEALIPRIHPELLDEGYPPHEITEAWVMAGDDADVLVDVTPVAAVKSEAIWCHTSQNGEARGDQGWYFEHRISPLMARMGAPAGLAYAEAFRRIVLREPTPPR